MAGWVRAPMGDDRGQALRADLDQLVLQAIIPERVRAMALGDRDREKAEALPAGRLGSRQERLAGEIAAKSAADTPA